jgi:hypothetical protein
MTSNDKQTIVTYLSGPRDWSEGVALYHKFGVNLRLKRQFAVDDTNTTRAILFDELRKLAGLSDVEFEHLPRKSVQKTENLNSKIVDNSDSENVDDDSALMSLADSFGITVDELVSLDFQQRVLAIPDNEDRINELTEELEQARSKYAAAPEPVRKMIRIRERFPFLSSDDCPDVLKILVADMMTAYGAYKSAYARLQVLDDDESAQAAAECETIVTEYLKNREIWDELEYYKANGSILGKAAKFREIEAEEDFTELSDVDLIAKLRSAQTNESKQKARVAAAKEKGEANEKAEAAYAMWTSRKQALQAELNRRKKK